MQFPIEQLEYYNSPPNSCVQMSLKSKKNIWLVGGRPNLGQTFFEIRSYLKPSLDPTQEICFWETSSFYLNTNWSSYYIRIFPTRENCHRHRCANLDQRNPDLFDILIFWSFFQTPSDHWGFQPCNSPTQKFQFFQIVTKIYWNPGKKNVLGRRCKIKNKK